MNQQFSQRIPMQAGISSTQQAAPKQHKPPVLPEMDLPRCLNYLADYSG